MDTMEFYEWILTSPWTKAYLIYSFVMGMIFFNVLFKMNKLGIKSSPRLIFNIGTLSGVCGIVSFTFFIFVLLINAIFLIRLQIQYGWEYAISLNIPYKIAVKISEDNIESKKEKESEENGYDKFDF